MKKKGQAGMMVSITVVLIIAVVVLQVIFSQVTDSTTQTAISDDNFTASNNTCVRITTDCMAPGTGTVQNATGGQDSSNNFTECGSNGDIFGWSLNIDGGAYLDGANVNTSYTQQSCSYITGSLTRLVAQNWPILFAIAMLVFLAGFIAIRR